MINREVYTILDCFGDIGGLYGALFAVFELFVVAFEDKLFNFEIASSIMRVKKKSDNSQNNFDPRQNTSLSKDKFKKIYK